MKSFLFLLCVTGFAAACEKGIDINLHKKSEKLVIDASIENGQPPFVVLTTSFDYFSRINPEILAGSFVHNADIFVSDGIKTHKLKEYTIDTAGGNEIYYYSVDSSDLSSAFTGMFGRMYSLRIVVDGKEYTATTTIPIPGATLDSLWWAKAPYNKDSNKVVLKGRITDPPEYGNYIRYFTKVNDEPFLPGLYSVYDDQLVNGVTYEMDIDRGLDKNKDNTDEDVFFERGDTITVKYCNIDRNTFEFWRTTEFNFQSNGNPFSSSVKVLGNIKGALGYFGGYAAAYKSIIIPW